MITAHTRDRRRKLAIGRIEQLGGVIMLLSGAVVGAAAAALAIREV